MSRQPASPTCAQLRSLYKPSKKQRAAVMALQVAIRRATEDAVSDSRMTEEEATFYKRTECDSAVERFTNQGRVRWSKADECINRDFSPPGAYIDHLTRVLRTIQAKARVK